jgi:RimJ/RimL family protein N-acetyltransferase
VILELRPWHPDDVPALRSAAAGDVDLARQFGGAMLDEPAAATEFLTANLLPRDETAHDFAITVDGEAVGNVGLHPIEPRHDTAWTSHWLAASHRGLGLATRALATVAAWGIDELGIFRLELGHRVNNPASCRVATRAGFVAEGIERKKLRYGVERYDVELHARLATDATPALDLLPLRTGG